MTEASLLWDSGGGGDASPHSEALTAKLFAAVMGATSANKGVVRGMLNELAPSISGTNILMNTGYAIVDGHPYYNDASLSTAISTPGVGTTGRRLVLRCSWSAQTVRATIISSAAGTITIPAMTQTPGTTYDIPIASFVTTTGGVSTITADDREFAGAPVDIVDALRAAQTNASTGVWKGYLWAPGAGCLGSGASGTSNGLLGCIFGGNATMIPSAGYTTDVMKAMGDIRTNAGLNDDAQIYSTWQIDPTTDSFELSAVVAIDNDANRQFFMGLCAGANPSDANNMIGFRVLNNGNLIAFTDNGGAETSFDTGAGGSAAPGTVYALKIVGNAGSIIFSVNGTTVLTTSTNVPTTAIYPLLGVRSTTAAQDKLPYRDFIGRMKAA